MVGLVLFCCVLFFVRVNDFRLVVYLNFALHLLFGFSDEFPVQ